MWQSTLVIPGKPRTDVWGSVIRQPSLMGELQISGRPCQKTRQLSEDAYCQPLMT